MNESGRVQSPCLYGRDPKDCSACQEAEAIYAGRAHGCCTLCKGTGYTYDPSTGGRCWDCRGTGCAHPDPCERVSAPARTPSPEGSA